MRPQPLPASTVRSNLVRVAAACAVAAALVACSETKEQVFDGTVIAPGDTSLPSAVVTERPPIPPTSYTLPCPWDTVADPYNNPYVVSNLAPDMIPAINEPKWRRIDEPFDDDNIDYAPSAGEPVVVVELGGTVRALPVAILLHHEVVNICWDEDQGVPYTFLTYCPLVDAAVHYTDPRLCKTKNKYGVSGALFNGNLIFYDRRSWVQGPETIFGVQMLSGGYLGSCLSADASTVVMNWAGFERLYPDGEVLSGNTGNVPPDGYDIISKPYWQYWRSDELVFPVSSNDTRLRRKEWVLGVLTPAARKAYPLWGESFLHNDVVGGERIVVWKDATFSTAVAHEAVVEGQPLTFSFAGREGVGLSLYIDEETGSYWNVEGIAVDGPLKGKRLPRAMTIRSFWFAWSSMFPDTELMTTE
jgi:hypothetical protein